jgi:hypothetical protein
VTKQNDRTFEFTISADTLTELNEHLTALVNSVNRDDIPLRKTKTAQHIYDLLNAWAKPRGCFVRIVAQRDRGRTGRGRVFTPEELDAEGIKAKGAPVADSFVVTDAVADVDEEFVG